MRGLDARRQPPGQQGLVVISCTGQGQGNQQFAQVAVAVDAVELAGLQQRVQVGARIGPGDRVTEEPVAAPDHEGADRVLARVVVDRVVPVLDVARELAPLP